MSRCPFASSWASGHVLGGCWAVLGGAGRRPLLGALGAWMSCCSPDCDRGDFEFPIPNSRKQRVQLEAPDRELDNENARVRVQCVSAIVHGQSAQPMRRDSIR